MMRAVKRQPSLFDDVRMDLARALELTAADLNLYGPSSRHWVVTFSGGKDSTATLTALHWLVREGRVRPPETLTALYADTRLELPPLQASALEVLRHLEAQGVRVRVVTPPLDHRFFVYMLGRGVPPSGARFRWCTGVMKMGPMNAALRALHRRHGRLLVITGVRIGESVARDQRIAISCSREGTECGQGYFQRDLPGGYGDYLAPIAHWRVCNVWDWLTYAPELGYPTQFVAEAYGGSEAQEVNARTGCMGCPVASRDLALETVVELPHWAYLRPLLRLRELWPELRAPHSRLRKRGERRRDGTLVKGGDRLGPLTFEARRYGLEYVLGIQREVNERARAEGRPEVELVTAEELARIHELWEQRVWPQGWDGDEIPGDQAFIPSAALEAGLQTLGLEEVP